MNREDFVSTKEMEEAVIRRKVNANGEPINQLNIQQFRKDELFYIFHKNSLVAKEPFSRLIFNGKTGKPRRSLKNVHHEMLYLVTRNSTEKT